jgi:hypothetical protein
MGGDDEPWDFDEERTRVDPRPPVDEAAPEPVPASPDTTGRYRLTPAQFAAGTDLAERDGFERGTRHGIALGEANAVTEARAIREDVIETFRGLWVIFELGQEGKPAPDWATAEAWVRRRLTPL